MCCLLLFAVVVVLFVVETSFRPLSFMMTSLTPCWLVGWLVGWLVVCVPVVSG